MRGLNCGGCNGHCSDGPYVTAYEIAQKHGFEGTEKEWVQATQSVFVARVKDAAGFEWDCDTTYEKILEESEIREVHLMTQEGRTAFMHGVSHGIGGDRIVFQTLPYKDDMDGSVYEEYLLFSNNYGTFTVGDSIAPGQGSIEKGMLSNAVQNLLDGAVQSGDQDTKTSGQNHAVGYDPITKKLYVQVPTDLIPMTVQPAKTEDMTNLVGTDASGQLFAEGYKKPDTGIPVTDMAQDVQKKIMNAGFKSIAFTESSGTYTFVDADFAFENVDDLIYQISHGANVRIVIMNTSDTYPAVHFQGSQSTARLYFSGPTVWSNPTYGVAIDAFELKDAGQSVALTRVYHEPI